MVSQYVQGHLEISDAVGTVTVVYSVVPGQANASEQLLHTPFPQGDANILENALPTIRAYYANVPVEVFVLIYPFHQQGITSSKDPINHSSITLISAAELQDIKNKSEDQLVKLKGKPSCHVQEHGGITSHTLDNLWPSVLKGLHQAINTPQTPR